MKYHFITFRMATVKKITSVGADTEKGGLLVGM